MTDDKLAVSQDDRERAAELFAEMGGTKTGCAMIRERLADEAPAVRAFAQARLAGERAGMEPWVEWAFDKSATHHRLAHENEHLRAEHIASSTAYRELALALKEAASITTGS